MQTSSELFLLDRYVCCSSLVWSENSVTESLVLRYHIVTSKITKDSIPFFSTWIVGRIKVFPPEKVSSYRMAEENQSFAGTVIDVYRCADSNIDRIFNILGKLVVVLKSGKNFISILSFLSTHRFWKQWVDPWLQFFSLKHSCRFIPPSPGRRKIMHTTPAPSTLLCHLVLNVFVAWER